MIENDSIKFLSLLNILFLSSFLGGKFVSPLAIYFFFKKKT